MACVNATNETGGNLTSNLTNGTGDPDEGGAANASGANEGQVPICTYPEVVVEEVQPIPDMEFNVKIKFHVYNISERTDVWTPRLPSPHDRHRNSLGVATWIRNDSFVLLDAMATARMLSLIHI